MRLLQNEEVAKAFRDMMRKGDDSTKPVQIERNRVVVIRRVHVRDHFSPPRLALAFAAIMGYAMGSRSRER